MKNLWKLMPYIGVVLVTSMYYFPIQLRWFPSLNTKMILAAFGLMIAGIECAREGKVAVSKGILQTVIVACFVSLAGFFSVVWNGTSDYSYASYIVSFAVWIFGAYTVIWCIRYVHTNVTVIHVVNYLTLVCVFQCVSALLISNVPAFKAFVDSWLVGFGFTSVADVQELGRVYGIGAALDVAGSRFCPVLVSVAFVIRQISGTKKDQVVYYLLAFAFIAVIGSIIGRTTLLGIIFGLLIILFPEMKSMAVIDTSYFKRITRLSWVIIIGMLVCVYYYNHSVAMRDSFRFAFEGFFSLAETGEWHVSSNDALMNMVVWPETLKTWIIGDGYFQGAANDMNFLGDSTMTAFYMRTDIGYLRFIFYFGLVGLVFFMYFFWRATKDCIHNHSDYKWIFYFSLLLNFVIWFKVSTDLFLFIALFMCFTSKDSLEETLESKSNPLY